MAPADNRVQGPSTLPTSLHSTTVEEVSAEGLFIPQRRSPYTPSITVRNEEDGETARDRTCGAAVYEPYGDDSRLAARLTSRGRRPQKAYPRPRRKSQGRESCQMEYGIFGNRLPADAPTLVTERGCDDEQTTGSRLPPGSGWSAREPWAQGPRPRHSFHHPCSRT